MGPHGEREKKSDLGAAKPYWLPPPPPLHLHVRVHLPQITILISHEQLPSGLIAQLVEQWWSVPEVVGSNPSGVRDFFSFSVWAHFLCRGTGNAQKVLFGIFIYSTLTYHI